MLKKLEDNFVLIYCFILFNLAFLFLGSEISTMRHDAEIRSANTKLQNCNVIVAKGTYEI
jgi:hypothetical protein